MRVRDAVLNEIEDAAVRGRPLAWIRVSTHAFEGSPCLVPASYPWHRDLVSSRSLELLVHPCDWLDMLVELHRLCELPPDRPVTEFAGYRVRRDESQIA